MSEAEILFEQRGSVAILTMNRPDRLNSFHKRSNATLLAYLQRCSDDDTIRAVVLTGAGRAFCSGADLTARQKDPTIPQSAWQPPRGYDLVPAAIQACAKVVVGAINGLAAGAGVAFALACDFRVAAETATLAPLQLQRAINIDYGLGYLLARAVGPARALDLITREEPVSAAEALALGLYQEVVAPEAVLDRALAWAERFARQPTVALAISKHTLHYGMAHSLAETIALESWGNAQVTKTADFAEGIAAFVERRKPVFTGR